MDPVGEYIVQQKGDCCGADLTLSIQTSKEYKALARCMCPKFLDFLRSAGKASPSLFSPEVEHVRSISMLRDLQHLYSAWVRLRKMRTSSHPWSEADYASQVYASLFSALIRPSHIT